ncbi:MAG TPA: acyl-CoA dehydrogenase family protein [Ilumatobacteraceae bacterium]|nr:acyl-CoA dehydrogenase family protein [Ilumatobacteraceae bacterium]
MTTSERIAPTTPIDALLTDEMLARFDERAPQYDRDNSFFEEDLAELRASGYLSCALPTEYGGAGLGLLGYTQLARRLGYVAPATALGVNMHIYWTGLAADLLRMGDESCRFILERAAEGDVFAAIHGEPGNDMPLLLSTTRAERVDGGWNISGHKIFGSMTPAWTYGGFHAMDTSDPEHPQIVHGFLPRDTPGIEIVDTWDTLGMRATQSQDTVLDEAFCPDELCPVVCPAGFAGAGPFHVAIFAWALTGFSAVYLGAARRAFDITLDKMPKRTSIALTHSMAHHPEVQHHVAKMRMAHDAAEALLDRTAGDWEAGVEHADWPVRLVANRQVVINAANDIVDRALDLSGGAGAFRANRLEQLFRDVRMGRFHPGNRLLAPELIGKLCLGIDPDSPQRWG